MKELTIEKKIARIKKTKTYLDVINAWFPPYYEKEYYFVSYSHKDYKLVYESLHRLQSGEKRLSLWYDHNLTPGRDWEIEARRYIYDFNCKGVIFFLSENAVLSQSIHKEIEFVKNSGKSYLSINLPCEKIKGHIGEYLAAAQMLELLKQQGYEIENYDEKSAVLNETFSSKITYLRFDQEIEWQIEKILSLKRQPLLNINRTIGIVTSINDINVTEIKKEDFEYFDENQCKHVAHSIGDCAFANCRQLSKVDLPESIRLIGRFAFYNCTNLKELNSPKLVVGIETKAFCGCSSLRSIYISANTILVEDQVFEGCRNLEKIIVDSDNTKYYSQDGILYNKQKTKILHVPQDIRGRIMIPNGITVINSIGVGVFFCCTNLESIMIPESVISIENFAFLNCVSLESIVVDTKNKEYSSLDGILYNKNKTELIVVPQAKIIVSIPDSVTSISGWAFDGCANLKDILYKGTKLQWKAIDKVDDWDKDTPDYTVHCTDGDLKKGEF